MRDRYHGEPACYESAARAGTPSSLAAPSSPPKTNTLPVQSLTSTPPSPQGNDDEALLAETRAMISVLTDFAARANQGSGQGRRGARSSEMEGQPITSQDSLQLVEEVHSKGARGPQRSGRLDWIQTHLAPRTRPHAHLTPTSRPPHAQASRWRRS